MTENFPNLLGELNINIQEGQQTPSKMNSKRLTLRHIIIKCLNAKNRRILKAAIEKWLIKCKGSSTILSVYFLTETLRVGRQWSNIFKMLKEKSPVNQESYIWQNSPSKMREKPRHSQIDKNCMSSSPLGLSCKKCSRESYRMK